MPEYRQYYDDGIQGHSLSQGHCKDYAGMSTGIIVLLLISISIGGTNSEEMWREIFLVFGLTDAWNCQELKSDMNIHDYGIIVQYQQFGVASNPKLRTHTDMR
jgi:hypothetical protein